jgi:hypothetical protein
MLHIFIITVIVFIYFTFVSKRGGAGGDFINIYDKIPKKQIKTISYKPFRGLYIVEEDPANNLPVWKITAEKRLYVWNAGWDFLPFARFHVERKYIDEQFRNLIEFRTKMEHMPYRLERLPHKLLIFEQYTLFRIEKSFADIVDYFQEEVRMVCRRRNKESHWEIFKKLKYPEIRPLNMNLSKYMQIQDDLWENAYSCTEIDPQILLSIVGWAKMHNISVSRILDMSAGRKF